MNRTFYDWISDEPKDKNKIILTTSNREYCLRDIERQMDNYISLLSQEDIKGKKIGLLVPDIFHNLSLVLAINRLGGTVVPLSWQFRMKDLTDVIEFLDPHIVLSISTYHKFDFMSVIEKWAQSCGKQTVLYKTSDYSVWDRKVLQGIERPGEIKRMDLICCSSGSTGKPKGIVMNSDNFWHWIEWCERFGDIKQTDRIMSTIPITALYGLGWILTALKNQTLVVINETFDLPQMIELFYNKQCNKMFSTPSIFRAFHTFFQRLKPQVAERLELCGLAGELITEDFLESVSELEHTRFVGNFGMSEGGGLMLNFDLQENLEWTVGDNVDFKILPLENDDSVGELIVHGPGRFEEYYQRPDLTAEILNRAGWLSTGDIVQRTGQRNVKVIGRKKDMIKKGGQQVIPGEIESVLLQHPLVKQAAVVGVPHKILGEKIVAFVKVELHFDVRELQADCSRKLAGYKVPELIKIVEEFPVIQGKIDKVTLRNMIVEGER